MNSLLFTLKPALTTDWPTIKAAKLIPTPEWLSKVIETDLVKSLTNYGDVYACTKSPYLTNQITMPYQHGWVSVLHMAFKEPFDNQNSISAIDIWGSGVNELSAQKALIRHVNNMWDYEALLTHFFFSDYPKGFLRDFGTVEPKYIYRLFNPQELARHRLTQGTNTHDGSRPGLNPCGLIFTNATLMNTKTR